MSGPRVKRTRCPGRRWPFHSFVCVHCDHRDGLADALFSSRGMGRRRDVADRVIYLPAPRSRSETRPLASCSAKGDPERPRHVEGGAQMSLASTDREAETAILLRMAASRAALLAANSTPSSVPAVHGRTRSPAVDVIASLADAPRVTLLVALCVGAIVLGPRRTIGIASRSGITAFLGSTVRKAILRSV